MHALALRLLHNQQSTHPVTQQPACLALFSPGHAVLSEVGVVAFELVEPRGLPLG